MLGIANEMLDAFENTCIQKCTLPSNNSEDDHNKTFSDDQQEPTDTDDDDDDEERETVNGVDDIWWNDGHTHSELPNNKSSKFYRAVDFKQGNIQTITHAF